MSGFWNIHIPLLGLFTLVLFFTESETQVTTCLDLTLPPDFCTQSCAGNAIGYCDSGFCVCQEACYTGMDPTPALPFADNCPLAGDTGVNNPLVLMPCQAGCEAGCAGSVGSVCGDATLNAAAGGVDAAQICICGCPSMACPTTTLAPVTITNKPLVSDTALLSSGIAVGLYATAIKFLKNFKLVYGALFFAAKIIFVKMALVGLVMLFVVISQLDIILLMLPPLVAGIAQTVTPGLA